MNTTEFRRAYAESRNGADQFFFNKLYRHFNYSSGVKECAEAGCYWLLDILGTELTKDKFHAKNSNFCVITVQVTEEGATTITGKFFDGDEQPYRKYMHSTLPKGKWIFYLQLASVSTTQEKVMCILPTEY